jgi:hypothetical protein
MDSIQNSSQLQNISISQSNISQISSSVSDGVELKPIRTKDCESEKSKSSNKVKEIRIYVDQSYDLVLLNCTQGAYQGIYNMNYHNRKTGMYTIVELEEYDIKDSKIKKNFEFCLRSHIYKYGYLEINCSGRGVGDCGSRNLYKSIPSQLSLKLAESKRKECMSNQLSKNSLTPEEIKEKLNFPTVYQNGDYSYNE